ncbi:MAG: KTSC domain-containing protein [Candidatus Aenigmatarchaeota archaeon]
MIRKPVSSSNINSIGYKSESGTLEIEFHSGSVYRYFNVPEPVYNALMNASSHGSYFHQCIKDQYRWTKIY